MSEEQDERTRALVQRLVETEQLLRERTAELAMYQSAATFRLATALGRLADGALPVGSRRRALSARAARRALGMSRGQSVREQVTAGARTRSTVTPAALPTSSSPVVSIVIPVHGKWGLTRDCLRSLAGTYAMTPYEVIVVDDASPDDTLERLGSVGGVRVHALRENVGFLRACNEGSRQARGEWVLLLNNDTEVQQGWLDALLAAARSAPDVGVVGARLLGGDGVAQEAGGIVFRDGSAWNYGRSMVPDDPRLLHRRDVDYVSGAVMLVRRALLEELGGFDERYAPAYYEDTDLAFEARARGLRVLYEPEAVVVHDEGGSHGRDTGSGIKSHQETNRLVFAEKWNTSLQAHALHDARWVSRARVHGAPRRLLVVDHQVPMPDQDSGSRRMRELLRLLARDGWAVTFVPDNGAALEPYTGDLRRSGVEVLPGGPAGALDLLGDGIEAVLLSRLHVAKRWHPLLQKRLRGVPMVFDTVDLHFLREERGAAARADTRAARTAERTRARELALIRDVDATLVVSPVEAEVLRQAVPEAHVAVVGNVEPAADTGSGPSGRSGLLFVGSTLHAPNIDALEWFVPQVLPLIAERVPDVVLRVVGSGPFDRLQALDGPRVDLVGWVPDLACAYASARVSVAPLRYGAGVKGKVGDALRHGLPVAGTTVAVEGMGLVDGQHVLVDDEPQALADAVVRLLQDDGLWQELREAGRAQVLREYSPERAAAALRAVLNRVAPPAASHVG